MRRLTFIRPGTLEWHDVPAPRLESASGALVHPVAVAACDLDVWLLRGRTPFEGPFACRSSTCTRAASGSSPDA